MRVMLDQEQVDKLLEESEHQAEVLIGLMKMVHPEFDQIKKFHDWPKCNKYTWHKICRRFIEFDKAHHPDVLAGGAWMNNGFSTEDGYRDWEVMPAIKVQYNGDPNPLERVWFMYGFRGKVRVMWQRRWTDNGYHMRHAAKLAQKLRDAGYHLEFGDRGGCYFTR